MSRRTVEEPRPSKRPLLAMSANSSWNLLNFCRGQIRGLQEAGYSIVAIVPEDESSAKLADLGVEVHHIPMSQHGISPVADLGLLARYMLLLRRLRPALFMGITAKPNVYGGIAAQLSGVPAVNSVTGLGTGFLSSRALELILSGLYWVAFRRSKQVFFLNRDDHDLFLERGLVRREIANIVPGSGIDLRWFRPAPAADQERLTFLFIGRMLTDKGVREYLEAASLLKAQDSSIRFQLLGPIEPHPKAVAIELLREFEGRGVVELLGNTDDVRPYIAAASCVVLPSYREGLPRVLVEAAAMSRPVIATDVPGCRDVVDDGITGLLCDAKSVDSLASKMWSFALMRPAERIQMGNLGRRKAEERFGDEAVVDGYLAVVEKILGISTEGGARSNSHG